MSYSSQSMTSNRRSRRTRTSAFVTAAAVALSCSGHSCSVSAFGVHEASMAFADSFHALQHAASAAVTHNAAAVAVSSTAGKATAAATAAAVTHPPTAFDLPNFLDLYRKSLVEHPLPTKMLTGATLAVAGDAIAQKTQSADSPDGVFKYDTKRATSFAIFDMAYRALQHKAFPLIVASCHGQYFSGLIQSLTHSTPAAVDAVVDPTYLAAMEQTLASQLGIVPFLYYPAFFALTGAIQGLDFDASMDRAKNSFGPLMTRNLLFWIPVQFIQFGFIPEDMQIPFLSVCGLAWTFILSIAAGSAKSYSTASGTAEAAMQQQHFDESEEQSLQQQALSYDDMTPEDYEEIMSQVVNQSVQSVPMADDIDASSSSSSSSRRPEQQLASSKV